MKIKPVSAPEKDLRENGDQLLPRYDANGLITAMIVDAKNNDPLMVAHMNEDALDATLKTGSVHFFSRSRNELWHKGATSGNTLKVSEIRIDCDQDALWISVEVAGHGAVCHTGRKSCFFRRVVTSDGATVLDPTGEEQLFNPEDVYPD